MSSRDWMNKKKPAAQSDTAKPAGPMNKNDRMKALLMKKKGK